MARKKRKKDKYARRRQVLGAMLALLSLLLLVSLISHHNLDDARIVRGIVCPRKTAPFRPLLYLGYPDSANMVEILANSIENYGDSLVTLAKGDVHITSEDFSSVSGRAIMNDSLGVLKLLDNPSARSGSSNISGQYIEVNYEQDFIDVITVLDSAHATFNQPTDSLETDYDKSVLSGRDMILDFDAGVLSQITCYPQAYSWYYPSAKGGAEVHENSVSGDTIKLRLKNERLDAVEITGGAIGTYVTGKQRPDDSTFILKPDTVDYTGQYIEYFVNDSVMNLYRDARVVSGDMSLDAHRVMFDIQRRVVEAHSASIDSSTVEPKDPYQPDIQPNNIPVVLHDATQEMYGNYLEYSIDTKKGRIVLSKSKDEKGLFYGDKLFREQEDIFYINDGRYTTCDKEQPHFHFRSKSLKVIQGNKMIARPVVFYLGRLPVMILPYYVFPLKKGRHSGFLPFEIGNFEKDVRYVTNVGYYWAASEYWDWQGAFDYYDNRNTFTLNTKLRFAKRYAITDTWLSGSYTRQTNYNRNTAEQIEDKNWSIAGKYNHQVTPSLKIASYWDYKSNEVLTHDLSNNLDERLNRSLKSSATLNKRFGKSTSLTVTMEHTEQLDLESRTDKLPSAWLSLPVMYPFGNGSRNEMGELEQKWFHDFKVSYSPNILNYSLRTTYYTPLNDTAIVVDSTWIDSTQTWDIALPDTTIMEDSLSQRSRKKFVKMVHSPRLTLPQMKFGNYITIIPSVNYSETWFKIMHTDQSDSADVEPDYYRSYSANASLRASTKLYGTIHPHLFILNSLRHVITPSLSFSYTPEIKDPHPEASSYVGVRGSSTRSAKAIVGFNQLFQSKYGTEGSEKKLDLLSLNSGFSYDFENDDRPYSDLSTTFSSRAIPAVSINGNLKHSLYEKDTNIVNFWSPSLKSYSISLILNLKGGFPLFDETASILEIDDSTKQTKPSGTKGHWSCRLDYRHSERGIFEGTWSKTDQIFAQLGLNFNLTQNTTVAFSQRYDFFNKKTLNTSINITRKLHCWTGTLHWTPTGSNKGFAFKLFITEIPDIKIDRGGHDNYSGGLQNLWK